MFTGTGNVLSMTYDGLRRLTSVTGGLRTSKTVNGTTYRYYYASGKLMRMTWGANIIDFFYDESGLPYAMKYNGTAYYYITNLQGDVMRIVDGRLKWQILQKLWICSIGICPLKFNPKEYP